jgi:hypothetical protein
MSRLDRELIKTMSCLGHHTFCSRYTGGGYKETKVVEGYNVEEVEGDGHKVLRIWSPREECLSLVFQEGSSTASLMWLSYNPKCRADGKMRQGIGTKNMLEFALRIAKTRGYTHVELSDTSKIDCGDEKVDLAPMYFLQHGMTWYENRFGFQVAPRYVKQYAELKQKWLTRLNNKEELAKKRCEYFTDEVVVNLFQSIGGDTGIFARASWIRKV